MSWWQNFSSRVIVYCEPEKLGIVELLEAIVQVREIFIGLFWKQFF